MTASLLFVVADTATATATATENSSPATTATPAAAAEKTARAVMTGFTRIK